MLATVQTLLIHQFEAALSKLRLCVEQCPGEAWDQPVINHAFCQVAFHALFFADYFLEKGEGGFREQAFHRSNADFFRDYEELEDKKPELLYDRDAIIKYALFCRDKAKTAIQSESEESLAAQCEFARQDFSRGERYVFTIRHLQHHAAQLSFKLRHDFGIAIPWVSSGWFDDQA